MSIQLRSKDTLWVVGDLGEKLGGNLGGNLGVW
jgi:hypothetical protein